MDINEHFDDIELKHFLNSIIKKLVIDNKSNNLKIERIKDQVIIDYIKKRV